MSEENEIIEMVKHFLLKILVKCPHCGAYQPKKDIDEPLTCLKCGEEINAFAKPQEITLVKCNVCGKTASYVICADCNLKNMAKIQIEEREALKQEIVVNLDNLYAFVLERMNDENEDPVRSLIRIRDTAYNAISKIKKRLKSKNV